jgi:hypothetical protein
MKSSVVVLCGLFVAGAGQFCGAQQSDSGAYSTPSYDGTGAGVRSSGTSRFGSTGTGATRTNVRTNANGNFGASFGTSLGTNLGTVSGTNLGQNLGVSGGAIIGQPNATIGQQGAGTVPTPGTAISPAEATNAVTPLGVGTAIPPADATNTVAVPGSTVAVPGAPVGIGQQGTVGIGQQGTAAIGQQGTVGIGQQNTTAIGQQAVGTAIMPPPTNGFIVNADGTVTPVPSAAQGGTADTSLSGTNSGTVSSPNTFIPRTNRFNPAFRTNRFNPTFGTNRFNTRP